MKIEEFVATFEFAFNGITTKKDSYNSLVTFLMRNGWIDENRCKSPKLHSFHSEGDGVCEVVFIGMTQQDIEEICDNFFDDLRECEDVKWAKVLYDNATEKLVYNHAYKYAENEFLLQNAEKGKIKLYVICR